MWQDLYFSIAGTVYFVFLLPAMFDKNTEMSKVTSWAYSGIMLCSGTVYLSMGLPGACAMMMVGSAQWAFLAIKRGTKNNGL